MTEVIQSYFFGISYDESMAGVPVGVAGFAIPDFGVVFRCRRNGTLYECQYAGLLSLLKFIDTNQKNLGQYAYETLSDSAIVVYQIAHSKFISRSLERYYAAAISYKEKVKYKVSWVPRNENLAIMGLGDVRPFKPDIDFDFDFDRADRERISVPGPSRSVESP